jgi:hypothetical protein
MAVHRSVGVCERTGIWLGLSDWVCVGEIFLAQKNLGKYLAFLLRLELAYLTRNLAVICKYLYTEHELCRGGCYAYDIWIFRSQASNQVDAQ